MCDKQNHSESVIQTDKHANRKADKQANRQADKQANRQSESKWKCEVIVKVKKNTIKMYGSERDTIKYKWKGKERKREREREKI